MYVCNIYYKVRYYMYIFYSTRRRMGSVVDIYNSCRYTLTREQLSNEHYQVEQLVVLIRYLSLSIYVCIYIDATPKHVAWLHKRHWYYTRYGWLRSTSCPHRIYLYMHIQQIYAEHTLLSSFFTIKRLASTNTVITSIINDREIINRVYSNE